MSFLQDDVARRAEQTAKSEDEGLQTCCALFFARTRSGGLGAPAMLAWYCSKLMESRMMGTSGALANAARKVMKKAIQFR